MSDPITEDLKRDEGLRLKPYLDTVGKTTIGYGRNLDDVGISEPEAAILLDHDIRRSLAYLDRALPWWRGLPAPSQRGLTNMAFNLGPRLLSFKLMLAALLAGDGSRAADEALDSKWAGQVGKERSERIAALYRHDKP